MATVRQKIHLAYCPKLWGQLYEPNGFQRLMIELSLVELHVSMNHDLRNKSSECRLIYRLVSNCLDIHTGFVFQTLYRPIQNYAGRVTL